jgi:hypothetical protein
MSAPNEVVSKARSSTSTSLGRPPMNFGPIHTAHRGLKSRVTSSSGFIRNVRRRRSSGEGVFENSTEHLVGTAGVAGAKRNPLEGRPRAPDYWEPEAAAVIAESAEASDDAAGDDIAA